MKFTANNSYRKPARSQAGFSIVELVVAIVVGVLFLSSINLIVNNYIHIGLRGRNLTLANSFASGKVEALRNAGYNSLDAGTSDISSELPPQLTSPKSGSMTISQPQTGLKQIDISITYSDDGVNRTSSFRTYIGELGVGQ